MASATYSHFVGQLWVRCEDYLKRYFRPTMKTNISLSVVIHQYRKVDLKGENRLILRRTLTSWQATHQTGRGKGWAMLTSRDCHVARWITRTMAEPRRLHGNLPKQLLQVCILSLCNGLITACIANEKTYRARQLTPGKNSIH